MCGGSPLSEISYLSCFVLFSFKVVGEIHRVVSILYTLVLPSLKPDS